MRFWKGNNSMCTIDKLKVFLDDNVKEVREILAKNGYYIDPISFAQLNVTQPIIKKVQNIEKNE